MKCSKQLSPNCTAYYNGECKSTGICKYQIKEEIEGVEIK